ncbi:MAG: sulfite exporter TauE/SafE family protein [Rickettsiales bacterium]|nr:sulfite exporter TauE/SafE family protein [Rickettsiales bacterium]
MSPAQLAVFFGVSFLAAAINSVAGGGTFLTFPVFILNGLTSAQANIMSTIALWPGVLASSYGYRSEMDQNKKALIPFIMIGMAGGAVGAFWFLATPESTFAALVPWLLLAATLIFTFGKYVVSGLNRLSLSARSRTCLAVGLQIVIAIYGGYFGAGIGILTLAMLQVLGHDSIHRMNALKTILTAAINSVTFVIFIASGEVLWGLSVVMIAGALCGGYVGARAALKVHPRHVRMLVSAIGFSMTAYFFLKGA